MEVAGLYFGRAQLLRNREPPMSDVTRILSAIERGDPATMTTCSMRSSRRVCEHGWLDQNERNGAATTSPRRRGSAVANVRYIQVRQIIICRMPQSASHNGYEMRRTKLRRDAALDPAWPPLGSVAERHLALWSCGTVRRQRQ
jgi:hypothetical protein